MTTDPARDPRRRAVFIDVDGTILADGRHIDPSTIEAIRGARANGHLVFLSTGRATAELTPDLLDIGFDGAVTNGGGFASVGDEVIVARLLSSAAVQRLTTVLTGRGVHWYFQSYDRLFAGPGLHALMAEIAAIERRAYLERAEAAGIEPTPDGLYPGLAAKVFADPAEFRDTEMAKVVLLGDDGEVLREILAELDGEFAVVGGTIPVPFVHSGEINPPGVNKGATILELLDHLGLDPVDAIGIGDNWNDAEMFEVCGLSFAMGNAEPAVQALADEVTTAVLDAGVWNAFVRAGLLGDAEILDRDGSAVA